MRVLITGGAGFIGSNFALWLHTRQPREVTKLAVLDGLTYAGSLNNLESVIADIDFIQADIRDSDVVESVVGRFDVVIHFAAETHNDNSLKTPKLFFETNVMGTLNVANACMKWDVRLHHVSTDEVFGDLPLGGSEEFTVSSPYKPSSPYSASKASSDHIIRAWTRSFGLRATISNCSNNYGPNQHVEKLIPATINALRRDEQPVIYGDGLNIRDWIHVDDHSSGIWLAVSQGAVGQTYLFGSNDRVHNIDLVRMLIRSYNGKVSEPKFVADRSGHDQKYAIDASYAIKELGWTPTEKSILTQGGYLLSIY